MPKVILSQEDTLKWLSGIHYKADSSEETSPDKLEKWVSRYCVNPSQIGHRAVEVPDLLKSNENHPLIYRFGNSVDSSDTPNGKDIGARTQFFVDRSTEIFSEFYPKQSNPPDHIVHVTCTGYASPSAAQRTIGRNRWSNKTGVTHAYHMGCYAALSGTRIAEGLVSSGHEKVDVVHTEMCSLHMNPLDHSPEQLVVQSLFADGHIKYSLVPTGSAKIGFSILNISEQIIEDSEDYMSWTPASWGMQMTLSRKVPQKIASQIKPFLEKLIAPTGYSLGAILKDAIFAVHPGGPSIIQGVQSTLELSDDQVRMSKNILFQRGNMSSSTLPHIWKEILDHGLASKQVVVSLAFGPGLTVFGAVFSVL